MATLKNSTGYKTLDRELEKDKYRGIIESFKNENSYGQKDGYWIYLNGYNFDGGAHIVHEPTITGLVDSLRCIEKCKCEKCRNNIPVWTDNSIHAQ